ncbi:hypothetical protein K490DRAFT_67919 [Saccharata proteae CBS 121410]|uniref:Uncharacterized protein n=1 Tax=Saccharata proteae CBS 121410 TaxID=1314787 RepID=A0A9P4HRU1_9PEZI|nr:hypothetical protein K490DRAFT_67919 [Saccharata proteae CBS 121410]
MDHHHLRRAVGFAQGPGIAFAGLALYGARSIFKKQSKANKSGDKQTGTILDEFQSVSPMKDYANTLESELAAAGFEATAIGNVQAAQSSDKSPIISVEMDSDDTAETVEATTIGHEQPVQSPAKRRDLPQWVDETVTPGRVAYSVLCNLIAFFVHLLEFLLQSETAAFAYSMANFLYIAYTIFCRLRTKPAKEEISRLDHSTLILKRLQEIEDRLNAEPQRVPAGNKTLRPDLSRLILNRLDQMDARLNALTQPAAA